MSSPRQGLLAKVLGVLGIVVCLAVRLTMFPVSSSMYGGLALLILACFARVPVVCVHCWDQSVGTSKVLAQGLRVH